MASEDVQTNLRLPANLKERLVASAAESNRSLSAEVTSRLEKSFDDLTDMKKQLLIAAVRLETVRDSFRVLATEASKQLSILTGANEVARLAANAAIEDFDTLVEIAEVLLSGDVRDRVGLESEINRLKRARQVIETQLERSTPPPLMPLAEAVRAGGNSDVD